MDITLVVMAAGMGSRFGGLKQVAPITSDGKGILDFSIYDAKKAGFNKVVFILREDMADIFKELIGNRISKTIDVDYVLQDTSILPEGRTKPFGTGHAILCCKDVVKTPFCIINADDYYGPNAFVNIAKHLRDAKPGEYAMVSYYLGNTVSKNGTVARGVCTIENGYLKEVNETKDIASDFSCTYKGKRTVLSKDTNVSMNIWGLTLDIFPYLEKKFATFLKEADLLKDEFYIPSVISDSLNDLHNTVKVYPNKDKWYGITYKEDLQEVKDALNSYIKEGLYNGL